MAHRLAVLASGRPFTPSKPFALHQCHVKACCNPDHLKVGDYQDNADDDRLVGTKHGNKKGYIPKSAMKEGHQRTVGTKNPRATLTEDQVRLIKQKLTNGEAISTIASELNTTVAIVRNIAAHKTWRHIT